MPPRNSQSTSSRSSDSMTILLMIPVPGAAFTTYSTRPKKILKSVRIYFVDVSQFVLKVSLELLDISLRQVFSRDSCVSAEELERKAMLGFTYRWSIVSLRKAKLGTIGTKSHLFVVCHNPLRRQLLNRSKVDFVGA